MPFGVVSGDSNGHIQQGSLPDGYYGGSLVWDKQVVNVKIFIGAGVNFDGTKFLAPAVGKRLAVLWASFSDVAVGASDTVMSAGPSCNLPVPTTTPPTGRYDLGVPLLVGDVDEGLKITGSDPASATSLMIAYCEV